MPARRTGAATCLRSARMTSFRVDFLGCKVSHVDAHDVRERLLADGHVERDVGADVAVISTCCVTNEAVAKSRKAVARAARTQSGTRHFRITGNLRQAWSCSRLGTF